MVRIGQHRKLSGRVGSAQQVVGCIYCVARFRLGLIDCTKGVMAIIVLSALMEIGRVEVMAARISDTLRLNVAVQLALEANPMVRAARLKADAARERIFQSSVLPDPELSFGVMNRMVQSPGATMDPMTMNQVQLTQMFPWFGKLEFARERATRLARAEELDAQELEWMLIAQVKTVYYQLAYLDRAIAIVHRSRDLLRTFVQVAETMYAAGTGLQQDVLQAQVGVAQLGEEITVMEQERIAMAARLNALLDRQATAPVPALELPQPSAALPTVDSLMARAQERRPQLRAAAERVAAAEAGYRLASREVFPDPMVGLSYNQRAQYPDMFSLMIGVRLPLWIESRQLAMRQEMDAMRLAAEAEARNLTNQTYAELVELRAEAQRSLQLSQLYATSILPQARAAVETALAAYRVGKIDYMSVVENQMMVNRYETESVRLVAAYWQALAEIEARVGGGVR